MLPEFPNLLLTELNSSKILIITINRPSYRNAVDTKTAHSLYSAFQYFNTSPHLISILTGSNSVFCGGADLQEVSKIPSDPKISSDVDTRLNDYGIGPMGPSRMVCTKPVLAAVQGYAVAGGLELAIWCDMIISHKDAVFGVFCRRFSVPLIDGGTVRLSKIIGYSRAMDMILTGRGIKGEEAFRWGLVNRLVNDKQNVMEEAVKLAEELCELPQECMKSDRISLMESTFGNLERDLRNENRIGKITMMKGVTTFGASQFAINKKGRGGGKINDSKL